MKEIMDALNLKDRKYVQEAYVTPAVEIGLVEPLYPNNPTHPYQKYRAVKK